MPRIEAPEQGVHLRMYRPGFGDCFLLTFGDAGGNAVHCLIDCGVHSHWKPGAPGGPTRNERIRMIAEHIREATGGHLHVVVISHEHADHVSGFHIAREVFEDMTVGEVWAPWTEDPDSDRARRLDRVRTLMFRQLRGMASNLRGLGDAYDNVGQVLGFFDIPADDQPFGVSTREARDRALALSPKKRFLTPHGPPLTLPGVEGIRVFVLGPPEDEGLLKDAHPKGTPGEVYEQHEPGTAASSPRPGDRLDFGAFEEDLQPFAGNHRIPLDWIESNPADYPFYHHHYGFEADADNAWRRIDDDLAATAEELALKLDAATNNTSLVLAFELGRGGRVLLFPGDAQVGNWNSWHLRKWTEENGAAAGEVVTAQDLLRRTVLYKVAHHGSHNATLKERGLEMMTSPELVAMIPVDETWARARRPYPWRMPFSPMYEELLQRTKGRIIRTDRGVSGDDDAWTPFAAPVEEELFVDLVIPAVRDAPASPGSGPREPRCGRG